MLSFLEETSLKSVNSLLKKLRFSRNLTDAEYRLLLKSTFALLSFEQHYNLCLSVICHVADKKPLSIIVKQLLYDCIVESRIFLYKNMLLRIDDRFADYVNSSAFDIFSQVFYTLQTGTTLTKDQKVIFDLFQENRRLIISAPTSFGKSRLITEIILANNYNNIAIILPTNALVNETYILIRNVLSLKRYKLITSLLQKTAENNNLFVFTPEKMDIFMDENPDFNFDLFIMDEIYKIDNDDRSSVFTNCLYRLEKTGSDFYLIGPYFNEFSKNFIASSNAKFVKFSTDIVQKDVYDVNKIHKKEIIKIENFSIKKKSSDKDNLLNIINEIDGQSLVYSGRRDTVEKVASYISKMRGSFFGKNPTIDESVSGLIEIIKENINADWDLCNFLANGIAFHHSGLPKYLQIEIINLFNSLHLDLIVCSPTLTEGVNTTAKNVIIYDNRKGPDPLLGFDVLNLKGRAGRFGKHFIGRVISLVDLPKQNELSNINFSFLDNENLEDESIVLLDDSEISSGLNTKKEKLQEKLRKSGLTLDLIKSNKYISIDKQIYLFQLLKSNPGLRKEIYYVGNIPSSYQLTEIFRLCYGALFSDDEKDSKAYSFDMLKNLLVDYLYINSSVKVIINRMRSDNINTKIRSAFTLITKRFEYTYPKYLSAFQNIYNYVNDDNINLKYIITKLEYGYTENHLIALKETGLPNSVIDKLSDTFSSCNTIEEIRLLYTEKYKGTQLANLSEYELKMIDRYL